MLLSTAYISLALFASSTCGLAFSGATATDSTREAAYTGELLNPPNPTKAPHVDAELMKRQNVQTALFAPDNTCGYISGLAGAAYYCYGTSETCAFLSTTAGSYGFVACCNGASCGARLTCIDAVQYSTQSLCDNGCEKDTFTLKCTASSAPYCNGARWPVESVQDYFCDDTSVSTWQLAYTSYSFEVGRTFRPVTITVTGNSAAASSAAQTSSVNIFPLPTTNSGTQSTTSGSSSTTSSGPGPTTTTAKKSTPVGAIAGGTVGGIAVLAAVGAALFFLLRRKNTNPVDANNGQPPPSYLPPGDSAFAGAGNKPSLTAQETQYGGTWAPQTGQGYSAVSQQPGQGYPAVSQQQGQGYSAVSQQPGQYSENAHGQQYQHQMAEAPGNMNFVPGALAAGAGAGALGAAAYDPHHSTVSQGPTTPYSQHSQPLSPNSTNHLSSSYPDRTETTSPASVNRTSVGTPGDVVTSSTGVGSPQQHYQAYTPYVPPVESHDEQAPTEMAANMAGPWPTNLHEGTWEAPGSETYRA